MEVESIYIFKSRDGKLKAKAAIDVPGIGEIKIEYAISDELCSILRDEVIAVMRVRLGQTLK